MIQVERRNKEKTQQIKQIVDIIKEQYPSVNKNDFLDKFKVLMGECKANTEKIQILTVAKNNLETKNVQQKQRIDQLILEKEGLVKEK